MQESAKGLLAARLRIGNSSKKEKLKVFDLFFLGDRALNKSKGFCFFGLFFFGFWFVVFLGGLELSTKG